MSSLQSVRGTHDLLPEEAKRHRYIESEAFRIASLYGFGEIITPIFEFTDVFARTLGESSDVVTKEMYSFTDRSGDSLTLRPEGTAGVARAFISGGMSGQLPVKMFYRGPMFRHERPQKGRQRQFHQVGVELLGIGNPQADIEVIAMGYHLLCELGLADQVVLEMNSLGDAESRDLYRKALVTYLDGRRGDLSKESLERLERNPLRVLDSKDEGDRAVTIDAPVLPDYLNEVSRDFFAKVTEGLQILKVPLKINPRLVRGLDYYCHTAFEFVTTSLGAQGTVLAGGRYDGLIAQMGGAVTPAIGWAAGIERLSMLLTNVPASLRPLVVIPMGDDGDALLMTQKLRKAGFRVELGYSGNMKKRMARADKLNARAALILGEEEKNRNSVAVRDLDSGTQDEVSLGMLEDYLVRFFDLPL